MTAEEVIANVLAAYARAGTYRDTGRVVTDRVSTGGGRYAARVREFRTAFVQPDRIRVEAWGVLNDKACHRAIAWAHGSEVQVWTRTRSASQPMRSLYLALLQAHLLDARPALAVHSLLLPELAGDSWLAHLTNLSLLQEGTLGDRPCHRLSCRCAWWDQPLSEEEKTAINHSITNALGERPPAGTTRHLPMTVWVNQETSLVCQMELQQLEADSASKTVVTFTPEAGAPVAEAELWFDPPAEAGA